jgi:hypothetical protein
MDSLTRLQKREVKDCNLQTISSCGITAEQLKGLVANPAGTNKADTPNPYYKNKIVYKNGKLHINLIYILTGDISRAEKGLKNIREVYGNGGVIINLAPNPVNFDIRIHGASLTEIVKGLNLCTCTAGLMIGGWAPTPQHFQWGNALLLASTTPKSTWKMTDAHEFGHKLGLKHRTDMGMMDYADPNKPDRRKFLASDHQRIINLYR